MSLADDVELFGDAYTFTQKLSLDEIDTRELPEAFKLTSTFSDIQERIDYAVEIRAPLMLLTGTHGAGKTFATSYYARKSAALRLECRPGYHAKHLLRHLCEALGIDAGNGWELRTSTVLAVLKSAPRVIIFDEAQRLDYNGLDLLKWVADGSGSTFILVASASLETRISRWEDIDSRCPVKLRVKALSVEEFASIYKVDGYSEEVLTAIHTQTKGVMRNIHYLFRHIDEAMAASTVVKRPAQLTPEHITYLCIKVFGRG